MDDYSRAEMFIKLRSAAIATEASNPQFACGIFTALAGFASSREETLRLCSTILDIAGFKFEKIGSDSHTIRVLTDFFSLTKEELANLLEGWI